MMRAKVLGVALAAVVGVCALAGGVQRAEAYYIQLSGTVSGSDGGNVLINEGDLTSPTEGFLSIYTNPRPIIELAIGNAVQASYTFFLDQPASVSINQADRDNLSLQASFGGAGFQTASEMSYGPTPPRFGSLATTTLIDPGSFETTGFRYRDVTNDGSAYVVDVTPFEITFSAIAEGAPSTSQFVLTVNSIRFADVGFVGPSVVPLPSTAPLFGAALLGIAGGAAWKRRRALA